MKSDDILYAVVPLAFAFLAVAILLWILWRNYVFAIKEDQRAVLIRMGRFAGVLGPGRVMILPFIDRLILISLSTVRSEFPISSVTTSDGISSNLQLTISSRITDPEAAVLKLENYMETMREFASQFLSEEARVSTAKT